MKNQSSERHNDRRVAKIVKSVKWHLNGFSMTLLKNCKHIVEKFKVEIDMNKKSKKRSNDDKLTTSNVSK